ncbi:MAG: chitobiase/beta-hexosaminidase C-terminal domain-containing protein [Bacteroides sp.]|nr:chitobiase/beta-hexosaminidase C-terminal domain-containing protein [Ruminococcus flavefaciens]MCM1555286.1 chitobiase/beta-hexosaminidase C-terminal domain-containing protein [Bacteroides sp.]
MKKLLFSSFTALTMLFSMVGFARAQDTEETAPTILPELVATPASGEVAAGSVIEFTIPAEYVMMPVYLLYTINNESTEINATFDELMGYGFEGDLNNCKVAAAMEGLWRVPCAIPADVMGEIKLRARMFTFVPSEEEDADPTVIASEVKEFTYTVKEAGPVVVPVPTFDPEGGDVEMNTTVKVECNEEPAEYYCMYTAYWVLDNEEFDFTQYDSEETVEEAGAKYTTPRITKETKVTAATAKIDMMQEKIVGWSEKVTMTYTIAPEIALTFDPADGATVDAGTKVTITANKEVDEINFKMYANLEEAQNANMSELFSGIYSETNKPEITAAAPVLKAAVVEGGWKVFYASYTVNGGGSEEPEEKPALIMNPDGSEPVPANQEITITRAADATTDGSIIYKLYADMATATADNGFTENFIFTTFNEYETAHPVITEEAPVLAVGIANVGDFASWIVKPVYVEYTVQGAEPALVTLSPDGSAPVKEGQEITISWTDESLTAVDIKYKWYASMTEAHADGDFKDYVGGGAEFYSEGKPVVTKAKPVLGVGVTDPDTWEKKGDIVYVTYTVEDADPTDEIVLTFDPEGNADMGIFGSSPVVLMEGDTVTITPSDNAKGTIYYVFSGSTLEGGDLLETAKTEEMDTAVKVYDPAHKPTLPYKTEGAEDGLCFLCAIFKGEDGEWSRMYSANYEVTSSFALTIPQPVFTPVAGEYTDSVYVQISCSDPTLEIVYAYGYDMVQIPDKDYYPKDSVGFKGLLVKSTTEIYARTISRRDENSSWEYSPLVTAKYTIKKSGEVEEPDTLPAPKFSVAAGEVKEGTKVALSCDTASAKIYYSINADTVTVNSAEYTGEITIDKAMTIKAIAVKEGFVSSKVAEAAYTIETANEGRELAGVRLYPNPTEGNFSVEAPVAAKVEIFNASGLIVKAFKMAAGVEEVRLANSGIYFVRITAENGQVAVRRVVVR